MSNPLQYDDEVGLMCGCRGIVVALNKEQVQIEFTDVAEECFNSDTFVGAKEWFSPEELTLLNAGAYSQRAQAWDKFVELHTKRGERNGR